MTNEDYWPCYGKPRLFDSTHLADHKIAAALCATCPAIEACARLLDDERRSRQHGAGPMGTWAGKLVGAGNANRNRRDAA